MWLNCLQLFRNCVSLLLRFTVNDKMIDLSFPFLSTDSLVDLIWRSLFMFACLLSVHIIICVCHCGIFFPNPPYQMIMIAVQILRHFVILFYDMIFAVRKLRLFVSNWIDNSVSFYVSIRLNVCQMSHHGSRHTQWWNRWNCLIRPWPWMIPLSDRSAKGIQLFDNLYVFLFRSLKLACVQSPLARPLWL